MAKIKKIRRKMMGGLQRHEDPAPGADHPLPHVSGVRVAEPDIKVVVVVSNNCKKALDSLLR